ncbi:hypothetical protein GGF37_002656 [Kickxella alabastrina]|nr:hypothetical protein GGF37_002656 [Kickxella alabastrina]
MLVCLTLALIVQSAPTNLAESTRPASFNIFSSKKSNEPSSEFRNTSSILLIGNRGISNMGYNNITFTDFNYGTIQIAPCGNWSGFEFQVSASACNIIILDIRNDTIVRDNARAEPGLQ